MTIYNINVRADLPRYVNANNLNKTGVEIGVLRGVFSEYILTHWKEGTLYSIDPWERKNTTHGDNLYTETKNKLSKFKKRSVILRKTSKAASILFDNNSLDFCYIDGNHKLKSVEEDIRLWWPKVKQTGVLCGHDYDSLHTGVKVAVDSFAEETKLLIHVDKDIDKSWYIKK
tara:strand:+ start:148 stop:663 length:516 start_codon:yes stop_codon:yes gene_type:complete